MYIYESFRIIFCVKLFTWQKMCTVHVSSVPIGVVSPIEYRTYKRQGSREFYDEYTIEWYLHNDVLEELISIDSHWIGVQVQ